MEATELLEKIFPNGLMSLDQAARFPMIKAAAKRLCGVVEGKTPTYNQARVPEESQKATERIVEMRKAGSEWKEISSEVKIGIGGCKKRYQDYNTVERLKSEVQQAPVKASNLADLLEAPIIPEEAPKAQDEDLGNEGKAKMGRPPREPGSLGEVCPKCGSNDVCLGGKDINGNKRIKCNMCGSQPTLKSQLGKFPANIEESPIERIETNDLPKKLPIGVPMALGRAEMNIWIWDMFTKERKTPAEISKIMTENGYLFSIDTVKRRLLQQGAKL